MESYNTSNNCQIIMIHVMNVNYILTNVFGGPLIVKNKSSSKMNPLFKMS